MLCSSCNKQKLNLIPRKSRLMKTVNLFLCKECDDNKMEPRFLIILVGRQKGPASVADYIKNHRYVGSPVLASELLV